MRKAVAEFIERERELVEPPPRAVAERRCRRSQARWDGRAERRRAPDSARLCLPGVRSSPTGPSRAAATATSRSTVDALLLIVALRRRRPAQPGRLLPAGAAREPALLCSCWPPGASTTRTRRSAASTARPAILGSTAVAALVVAALVQLTHPIGHRQRADRDPVRARHRAAAGLAHALGDGAAARARRRRLCGRRTLIIGAGEVGAALERHLGRLPQLGLIAVGFVDDEPLSREEAGRRELPVLGHDRRVRRDRRRDRRRARDLRLPGRRPIRPCAGSSAGAATAR